MRDLLTGAPRCGLVFLLGVLGLSGCQESAAELGEPRVRDSAGIAIVENPDLTDDIWRLDTMPELEIGGAAAPSLDLFRIVGGVRLSDGRIVVADGAQRLLAFSQRGDLLRSAGQRGSGPGEFQSIAWVQRLPGDSIMVYDARLMRASVFTDGLRLARTVAPDRARFADVPFPQLRGVFQDGTLLAASRSMVDAPASGNGIVRPNSVFYRLDASGSLLDSLTTVPGDELAILQGVIVRPRFVKQTKLVVGADEFFVATGDRFEVSFHDLDGRITRFARKPHQVLPVTDEDLAPLRSAIQEDFQAPASLPAVGSMLLDDAGNLWVEEFWSDTVGSSAWVVFDSQGRVVGRLTFVERFVPLHVGRDFVLGVWRDELDVERVRVYRLSPPD